MKISAHQPDFLPWVGFWNKVVSTDLMIIRLRDAIDSSTGARCMTTTGRLTIPVTGEPLYEKALAIPNYRKLRERIRQDLMSSKNKFRSRLEPIMEALVWFEEKQSPTTLAQFNTSLMLKTADILGVDQKKFLFNRRDELALYADERLQESCEVVAGGKGKFVYYSGAGGREYMSPIRFKSPVLFQRVIEKHGGVTMLQLIATLEDPMEAIKSCAIWEEW